MSCLFCKILKGEIPSKKAFENENVLGFHDITPQAKGHVLFIHKNHTSNLTELMNLQPNQIQDLFSAMRDFARSQNLEEAGFRVVTNQGKHAGQTVFHTHFHMLYGENLSGFGR